MRLRCMCSSYKRLELADEDANGGEGDFSIAASPAAEGSVRQMILPPSKGQDPSGEVQGEQQGVPPVACQTIHWPQWVPTPVPLYLAACRQREWKLLGGWSGNAQQ